jgi:hypothetical protein
MLASTRLGWLGVVLLAAGVAGAQEVGTQKVGASQDAHEWVRMAVQTELAANRDDRSRWEYKDVYQGDSGEKVFRVIETDKGTVKKKIEENGRPLTPEELKLEDARIDGFVHDEGQVAKQRKDGAQDDKRAQNMLRMLPDAFLWTVKDEDEKNVTLEFAPNPRFEPPSMELKVFAAMTGEIVLDKQQHRIRTMKGTLIRDVKFGMGLFGRMNQGGTFDVERRELAPGIWQITESHVHIQGHALLFKSIGEQEDEVKSEFRRSPVDTLERAAGVLKGEPSSLNANGALSTH